MDFSFFQSMSFLDIIPLRTKGIIMKNSILEIIEMRYGGLLVVRLKGLQIKDLKFKSELLSLRILWILIGGVFMEEKSMTLIRLECRLQ